MIGVEHFDTHEASSEFLYDLRMLLNAAFGDSFSEDDWDHGIDGRHFALIRDGILTSYCAVVPRTIYIDEKPYSCGYLENVATAPDKRHQGFASKVVREANSFIATNFDIGALSSSKHDFYRKFDWQVWHGPTFVISSGIRRPSDAEIGGGIMVLETDAIPNLDFRSRIACDDRPGDAW